MKRFIILLLVAVMLCGCQTKPQTQQTEPSFNGLILEASTNATVTLYMGVKDGVPMTPSESTQQNELVCYYFPGVQGSCYYTVSAAGCYSYARALYVEPGQETRIRVDHPAYAGTGWEPERIQQYSVQMMDYKPDDPTLWPDYQEAFSTPAFDDGHAAHQSTTQPELEAFIKDLDDADDRMYIYSAGKSAYGQDVPLVIFTATDLSEAQTLEQAAELLRENGKLTLHYQGHIHGNEPAGGEAALAMIKRLDSDSGTALTDKINIYVIPRLNPDGAQKYTRKTAATNVDPNRDLFKLGEVETRNLVKAVQLLEPQIMIDSHEYTANIYKEEGVYADMQVSPGFVTDPKEELASLSLALVQDVFGKLEEQGLSYKYYLDTLNSENVTTVRDYFCRQGKLTFVLESMGINYGNTTLGRRTVGHMISAWQIMEQVAAQPQLYLDAVNRWKENTVNAGLSYTEDDVVILQRATSKHPEYDLVMEYFQLHPGYRSSKRVETKINDVIVRSRPAPTAYVIPAGEAWTDQVLAHMDLHGISYTKLPAGSKLYLQQYTGTTDYAELTAQQQITFSKLSAVEALRRWTFCRRVNTSVSLALSLMTEFTNTLPHL